MIGLYIYFACFSWLMLILKTMIFYLHYLIVGILVMNISMIQMKREITTGSISSMICKITSFILFYRHWHRIIYHRNTIFRYPILHPFLINSQFCINRATQIKMVLPTLSWCVIHTKYATIAQILQHTGPKKLKLSIMGSKNLELSIIGTTLLTNELLYVLSPVCTTIITTERQCMTEFIPLTI